MTIGEQIQNLRIEKGLTQEQLAEELEISRQSVSKWELGQAIPDIDKIVKLSEVFDVTTDKLLLKDEAEDKEKNNPLHFMNLYIIVSDFDRTIEFYEKFLNTKIAKHQKESKKVAQFFVYGGCITVMNKNHMMHDSNICSRNSIIDDNNKQENKKCASNMLIQTYWVEDLVREYKRLRELNIGEMTLILDEYPNYHYFQITDPEGNIIEINGGYQMNLEFCQSCGMPLKGGNYGKNADGSDNKDYCSYCFVDGHFCNDITLEEMIELNVKYIDEFNKNSEKKVTEEELRAMLSKSLPQLKRWKKQ